MVEPYLAAVHLPVLPVVEALRFDGNAFFGYGSFAEHCPWPRTVDALTISLQPLPQLIEHGFLFLVERTVST